MEEWTEHLRAQSWPLGCWHWPVGAQARVFVTVSYELLCDKTPKQWIRTSVYLSMTLWVDNGLLLPGLSCAVSWWVGWLGRLTGLRHMSGGWCWLSVGWSGDLSWISSSVPPVASHPFRGLDPTLPGSLRSQMQERKLQGLSRSRLGSHTASLLPCAIGHSKSKANAGSRRWERDSAS